MIKRVPATEAARNLSELLNRVRYRGEEFVIERGGQPVCRMVPAGPSGFTLGDLAQLLDSIAKPDAGYWRAVEQAARKQPKVPKSPWRS